MKGSIAVALIVTGALLIMAPALSDHVYWQRFLAQVSNPNVGGPPVYSYFTARMDGNSQLAFWSTGVAVLSAAFFFRRRRAASAPEQ